jgi:hypothetical protein
VNTSKGNNMSLYNMWIWLSTFVVYHVYTMRQKNNLIKELQLENHSLYNENILLTNRVIDLHQRLLSKK